MAITRGQMQRQLRRGGGIMNVASGTIGGGNYAGIPMGSRTGFGIVDKLKDRVRKIIPNEISKVATVAAPFVAPFNPALAGAMAGIGSFDQSGSISDALKRGALTYGGGQLARGIGGGMQNLQALPGTEGFGGFGGFTKFSSPISSQGGIGKLLEGVKGVGPQGLTGSDVGGNITLAESAGGTSASPTILAEQMSETSLTPRTITETITESAPESVMKAIQNKDYGQAAKLAAEKGFNAIFKKPVRNDAGKIVDYDLDKTALFAAGAFGLTYADAKKIADDAGVDIGTETEYDEATKDEFKEKYAGYLTNFFEGKKDGGRIGFNKGTEPEYGTKEYFKNNLDVLELDEYIKKPYTLNPFAIGVIEERLKEYADSGGDISPYLEKYNLAKQKNAEYFQSLSEDEKKSYINRHKQMLQEDVEMGIFPGQDKLGIIDIEKETDSGGTIPAPEKDIFDIEGFKDKYGYRIDVATGGRIGYKFGDRVEDDEGIMSMSEDKEDEDMKMAYFPGDVFSKSEISRLFSDKSLTTNQDRKNLYRILMNPGMFPEAEDMLKKLLRGKKEGGRIGFRGGSNRMMETFRMLEKAIEDKDMDLAEELKTILRNEFSQKLAKGGRINYNMGSEVPVRKNKAGIEELDYRQTGGFVPIGVKEKADDVPAMLSKNEFVLTADAVRGIGGGDVEKGAEKLYGVMKQAEKVGRA